MWLDRLQTVQPQDLALTILGTHLRDRDQRAWSGGMVELLGQFGFSVEASRAALNRLASRELVTRQKSGREVFYRLTARAQEILAEGDARIFGFGRMDTNGRRWTVLWHSLPESRRTERASLATRLRFLGFGSIQDATWVAPHDREREVLALLDHLDVAEYTYVLVGRPVKQLDVATVIGQAWDLADVTDRYRSFLDEFRPFRSKRAERALSAAESFVVLTRAVHQFRRFPLLDPELPDELMPEPRLRPAVVNLFDQIFDGLHAPAQRHFDLVTRSSSAAD